jgi:hypothetical protein
LPRSGLIQPCPQDLFGYQGAYLLGTRSSGVVDSVCTHTPVYWHSELSTVVLHAHICSRVLRPHTYSSHIVQRRAAICLLSHVCRIPHIYLDYDLASQQLQGRCFPWRHRSSQPFTDQFSLVPAVSIWNALLCSSLGAACFCMARHCLLFRMWSLALAFRHCALSSLLRALCSAMPFVVPRQ